MLELVAASKHFRGLKAVSEASLKVEQGEIVALIGPNGAGKTTLFNLVAGVFPPSSGRILFEGRDITGLRPDQVCNAGIGRTFQIVKPFADMTVTENAMVGGFRGTRDSSLARARAETALHSLGMWPLRDRVAASLTLPDRKRLEVARALATQPRLLLLDEVMAGLRPTETDEMVRVFRRLNSEHGVTILLIEHVMRAVMALAQRVYVLHHGEIIATGTPAEVTRDPRVLRELSRRRRDRMMKADDASFPSRAPRSVRVGRSPGIEAPTMMLEVRDLSVFYDDAPALAAVSLDVAEGEIVAIIGANGAGKTSLIRCVGGVIAPRQGSIRFEGREIAGQPSHRVCNLGIGQVAEGRQVFPSLTVLENLQVGAMLPRARAGAADTLERVYAMFPRLHERRQQSAGTLSGGEQQMLAIGRCLMGAPRLIMFDEPSLGLAPAIVGEVLRVIERLNREDGMTVLLVEQNVAASLRLAHRAYVLENGSVVLEGAGSALLDDPRVREAYLGL